MKTPLADRLLEWFADSSPRTQYPAPRWQRKQREPSGLRWKYQMPLWKRLFIASIALFVIMIALPLLAAMLLFAWDVIK